MDDVLVEVVKVVGAIAAPVLATLVTALLVKTLKKIGLEVDAEQQAKTEHLVRRAILRAEEWAATRVKAKYGTTTAEMKLQRAMQDVLEHVPGLTPPEAAALIHAKLPELQLGAASFPPGARQPATAEPAR